MNQYPRDTILTFRHDKTVKYVREMARMVQEGVKLREKVMMRQAIRNQQEEEEGEWARDE